MSETWDTTVGQCWDIPFSEADLLAVPLSRPLRRGTGGHLCQSIAFIEKRLSRVIFSRGTLVLAGGPQSTTCRPPSDRPYRRPARLRPAADARKMPAAEAVQLALEAASRLKKPIEDLGRYQFCSRDYDGI